MFMGYWSFQVNFWWFQRSTKECELNLWTTLNLWYVMLCCVYVRVAFIFRVTHSLRELLLPWMHALGRAMVNMTPCNPLKLINATALIERGLSKFGHVSNELHLLSKRDSSLLRCSRWWMTAWPEVLHNLTWRNYVFHGHHFPVGSLLALQYSCSPYDTAQYRSET